MSGIANQHGVMESVYMSEPWKVPTRRQAAWFWMRSRWLIAHRSARNLLDGDHRRWPKSVELAEEPIIAQVVSPLWDDTRPDEFVLLAGKVHNLRTAAKAFSTIVVPAQGVLSFWRQLGRPVKRRGYVKGREVREGCVIPTIAGGICQLSNALAMCAERAGFELLERHAHSVAGADTDRGDATVFWNYVDLRIRAPVPWRVEVVLTERDLRVTIRSREHRFMQDSPRDISTPRPLSLVARGCMTCNELSCFRHRPALGRRHSSSAWLLDTATPEFISYLATKEFPADRIQSLPPRHMINGLIGRPVVDPWSRGSEKAACKVHFAIAVSAWRSWLLRRAAWSQGRRQAVLMKAARLMAWAYARRLRPEHTHLVVDQALLPHLYQSGVLGGRTYEVLAQALPMREIQQRLDQVARAGLANPVTLTDFRAEDDLVDAECQAMLRAQRVATAHQEVADYWRAQGTVQVEKLSWVRPEKALREPPRNDLPVIVFPASALARKGAYELASALRGLHCRVLVLGSPSDDMSLWKGMTVEHAGWRPASWLPRADLVILPAHVEHSPRAVLLALAAGVPVIVTPACGLREESGVVLVPAGDVQALRGAVLALIGSAQA
jgi:glycosyltransferase involved in cell wall biosynthesis